MRTDKTTDLDGRTTDLISEIFQAKPELPAPLYDELLEIGDGVHHFAPANMFLVFRYDDVQAIGRDHHRFSTDAFDLAPMAMHDQDNPEHVRFMNISRRAMPFYDPPRHTELRNIFRKAFTPKAIAGWQITIERAVGRLLDQFEAGQEVDFVQQLSIDVPVDAICAVMGITEIDRSMIRKGSSGFGATFDPAVVGEGRDRAINDALMLFDYLEKEIADRSAHRRDDLISLALDAAAEDAARLTPADVLAQIAFLLGAGNETTVDLLSWGIWRLLQHPDQRAILSDEPTLIDGFINETLRLSPPIDAPGPRLTTRATTLGETELPAGSFVLQMLAAANRDPRKFDDPATFRISRSPNPMLSFNQGAHTCLGAPLSRLEARLFFQGFLARFPDFGAGIGEAKRNSGKFLQRSLTSLPVRL